MNLDTSKVQSFPGEFRNNSTKVTDSGGSDKYMAKKTFLHLIILLWDYWSGRARRNDNSSYTRNFVKKQASVKKPGHRSPIMGHGEDVKFRDIPLTMHGQPIQVIWQLKLHHQYTYKKLARMLLNSRIERMLMINMKQSQFANAYIPNRWPRSIVCCRVRLSEFCLIEYDEIDNSISFITV